MAQTIEVEQADTLARLAIAHRQARKPRGSLPDETLAAISIILIIAIFRPDATWRAEISATHLNLSFRKRLLNSSIDQVFHIFYVISRLVLDAHTLPTR
jgi:hypothetical protein